MTEVDEAPDALIGRRLGHYLVIEGIGGGAMGHVYRARDVVLRRSVALKVHKNRRGDAGLRRFLQESRAAQALQHPAIAEIYESGQSGPYHFLAMELVEGPTLGDLLARGPLGWEAAVAIGREIASALGYAHRHGVVHRDLKPTNVLVSRGGRVKLVDFGLAKQIAMPEPGESESTIYEWSEVRTAAGAVLGTPAYMSPEQARAKPIDARADVFALGIVLSELIDGRPVFRRSSPAATIGAILTQKPDRIDRASPSVPSWVADVIERCLEKAPAARFADGSEVLFALEAWSTPEVDLSALAQTSAPDRLASMRAPSLAPSNASLSIAPASSARFIGRKEEREQLRTALLRGERLVTICGPSGVGKTRLVRQHLADWGHDETVLLELAGVRTEEDFLLACALGLRLREHEGATEHLLRRLVERRPKLVVLDGLDEALPFALAHVAAWREKTTGTAFVITSRGPVAIEEGIVMTLEGLPIHEATELFLEQAMAGVEDPVAMLDQGAAATSIAEHLEGIPLAVELAAARAQSVGPEEVLLQILHDLAWLEPTGASAERPGLGAVLDASIRRLDPETRSALLSLSVLRSFDLAGASAVTGLARTNAETLIARLVSLSLALAAPHPELLSEARWAIREPVRRRAEETLAREGGRHAALGTAAGHLAAFARRHREALRTAPEQETFRDILAESASYFALAETALREPGERLEAAALEGIVAYAEAATKEDAEARATPLLEPLVDRLLARPAAPRDLLGDALVARGSMRLSRGDAMAIADADRALSLAGEIASLPHEARARSLRAAALLAQRRPDDAADEAERAAEVAHRCGDVPALASTLEVLAEASLAASRLARADHAVLHAGNLAEARNDVRTRARLTILASEIARELEDDARARGLLLEALDLTNATGQVDRTPLVLLALGELQHRRGELEAARETYARALSLCPPDASPLAHARLGLALSQLETELGNPERAVAISASVIETLAFASAPAQLEALALATRAATLAGAGELATAGEPLARATLRAAELDPLVRSAVGLWAAHLDVAIQTSAAGIERAREHLALAAAPARTKADLRVSPGSRHAHAIAVRVLEAVLPRRLSLLP